MNAARDGSSTDFTESPEVFMKSSVSTTDENIPPLGYILEAGGKLVDSWASDLIVSSCACGQKRPSGFRKYLRVVLFSFGFVYDRYLMMDDLLFLS